MEMLLGAALIWVGFFVGVWFGRRNRVPQDPNKPICECGHSIVLHDAKTKTKRCLHNDWETYRNSYGFKTKRSIPCNCTHYVGPEPLPRFYAPELGE